MWGHLFTQKNPEETGSNFYLLKRLMHLFWVFVHLYNPIDSEISHQSNKNKIGCITYCRHEFEREFKKVLKSVNQRIHDYDKFVAKIIIFPIHIPFICVYQFF
jgi:hypothetical protein